VKEGDVMGRIAFTELILLPFVFIVPALVLYFIIKTAIKHAIKELKDDNIL